MIRLSKFREVKRTYQAALASDNRYVREDANYRVLNLEHLLIEALRRNGRYRPRTRVRRFIEAWLGSPLIECPYLYDIFVQALGVEMGNGQTYHPRVMHDVRGCIECERVFLLNEMAVVEDRYSGRMVCLSCRDQHGYRRSRRVGAWIHPDDWDPDLHEDGAEILSYRADPRNYARGNTFRLAPGQRPNNVIWLGVELEVVPRSEEFDDRNSAVRRASKALREVGIIKHDGSVNDAGGFEIASFPGSLEWHHQAWRPFLADARQYLRSWTAESSCGIHVHVDRETLGELGCGKLMAFIHDKQNRDFLQQIAGRGQNDYVIYEPGYSDQRGDFRRDTKVTSIKAGHRTHYDAAGPSDEYNTIEVRIFRGNVDERGFFRVVEFTESLARFCRGDFAMASGIQALLLEGGLTVPKYLAWFAQPAVRKRYPALQDWLIRRRYLQVKKRLPEQVLEAV